MGQGDEHRNRRTRYSTRDTLDSGSVRSREMIPHVCPEYLTRGVNLAFQENPQWGKCFFEGICRQPTTPESGWLTPTGRAGYSRRVERGISRSCTRKERKFQTPRLFQDSPKTRLSEAARGPPGFFDVLRVVWLLSVLLPGLLPCAFVFFPELASCAQTRTGYPQRSN